jgi:hypothetical protein
MWRYPAGYGFPVPFGVPACASCAFLYPLQSWPALAMRLLDSSRLQRGSHVPHRPAALGALASRRRERGTVSTGPLTPVCPENLKLFTSLTFFEFLFMLEQRTPPSSHMSW